MYWTTGIAYIQVLTMQEDPDYISKYTIAFSINNYH